MSRYWMLTFFGTVLKVLGVLSGLIAIISGLAGCMVTASISQAIQQFASDSGLGALGGVVSGSLAVLVTLCGLVIALSIYAGGEMIHLMIDLERNTSTAMYLLESLVRGQEQP